MNGITCEVESKRLEKYIRSVGTDKVPKACVQALNRAASTMQTATVREAASKLKVAQRVMRSRVRFPRYAKASLDKLRSKNYDVIKDVPVIIFGKPTKTKIGARIRGITYPHAFAATLYPGGKLGVYRRKGKPRFPVETVKAPIRDILGPIAVKQLRITGLPAFEKRFSHELYRRLQLGGTP
jgi:hypothetical protein